ARCSVYRPRKTHRDIVGGTFHSRPYARSGVGYAYTFADTIIAIEWSSNVGIEWTRQSVVVRAICPSIDKAVLCFSRQGNRRGKPEPDSVVCRVRNPRIDRYRFR